MIMHPWALFQITEARGGEVHVNMEDHKEEEFKKPKVSRTPFQMIIWNSFELSFSNGQPGTFLNDNSEQFRMHSFCCYELTASCFVLVQSDITCTQQFSTRATMMVSSQITRTKCNSRRNSHYFPSISLGYYNRGPGDPSYQQLFSVGLRQAFPRRRPRPRVCRSGRRRRGRACCCSCRGCHSWPGATQGSGNVST
jgi:hypothetical protein